jgi:hypothetical protein
MKHKQRQPLVRLKHWFIPGRHNHFHPTALRPVGLAVMVLVIAFIPTIYNAVSAGKMQVLGYATNVTVGDIASLSNAERAKRGLGALSLNSQLSQAAYNKAKHMFANDYWAHTAPDGTTPWSFIKAAGYSYTLAGENLAKNFNTSAGVVNGWMNSPAHRDNILGSTYKHAGYAVMNGTLQGQQTTLVVAMYGAPKATTQTTQPVAKTTTTPTTTSPTTTTPPASEPKKTTPTKKTPTKAATAPKATQTEEPQQQTETPVQTDTNASGEVEGATITAPIEAYLTLNWGQKASLFLLSALGLLFVMKHTAIWRARRRGLRHVWLRSHPLAQGSILVAGIIITLASGTGSII